MRGSQHNDAFYSEDGKIHTKTNNAGGTIGGISSGETIHFRVVFKPVSTIKKEQDTVTKGGKATKLEAPAATTRASSPAPFR